MKKKAPKSPAKGTVQLKDIPPRKNPKGGRQALAGTQTAKGGRTLDGIQVNHNEAFVIDAGR